jgi:hypothetical protein
MYALATAAEERRANQAIAQLRRASTSSNATVSTLNLHADAPPAAAPGVPGNLSHVHDIANVPTANDNRMPNLSFQKEQLQIVAQPQVQAPTAAASGALSNSRRKPSFADKLHAILSNKNLANIITWLPSGKSFCILDKEIFVRKVLPTYFRDVQFDSFSRRIKRWGFRRMYTTGLKQVTYTHDLFQKDRIDLLKMMNGRSEQATSIEAPRDAVVDAAKIEAAVTEQVTLEKTVFARPSAAWKQERTNAQTPVKKRFVQSHRAAFDSTYDATVGAHQATFRFNERPFLIGYEQKALFAPSQLHLQQTNLHEMSFMNRHPPPMASIIFGRSQLEPKLVPYQGKTDMNATMQLASLHNDIAECEAQLAILQKLRDLKERRRALENTFH